MGAVPWVESACNIQHEAGRHSKAAAEPVKQGVLVSGSDLWACNFCNSQQEPVRCSKAAAEHLQ